MRNFTLIELIILVGVGSIALFAMGAAAPQANGAGCRNNLAQFYRVITEIKKYNGGEYPEYLSYAINKPALLICDNDTTGGKEGSRPDWINGQYAETNDMALKDMSEIDRSEMSKNCWSAPFAAPLPEKQGENRKIKGCSYLYEFCGARCSWSGGVASWGAIKQAEVKEFGDKVPLVRCYYHMPRESSRRNFNRRGADKVFNLRVSGAIDYSSPDWQGDQ